MNAISNDGRAALHAGYPISRRLGLDLRADPALTRRSSEVPRPSYGLDTYPNQIEIITAEQMLDAYRLGGPADRLPALVVRQGVHPQRAALPQGQQGWPTRSSSTPTLHLAT